MRSRQRNPQEIGGYVEPKIGVPSRHQAMFVRQGSYDKGQILEASPEAINTCCEYRRNRGQCTSPDHYARVERGHLYCDAKLGHLIRYRFNRINDQRRDPEFFE